MRLISFKLYQTNRPGTGPQKWGILTSVVQPSAHVVSSQRLAGAERPQGRCYAIPTRKGRGSFRPSMLGNTRVRFPPRGLRHAIVGTKGRHVYMRRSSRITTPPPPICLAEQSTLVDPLVSHDNSEHPKQDRVSIPFPHIPLLPATVTTAPPGQDRPRIDIFVLVQEKRKARRFQQRSHLG